METGQRTELINEYYAAIDDEEFDRFREVFDADVEYRYPGESTMHGVEEVVSFFRERREHSNSTHEVHRRISDGEATVCEGTITAENPDGSRLEGGFVGVFEFDDATETIDRTGVYVCP